MSSIEQLIEKLLTKPRDFTWNELGKLLKSYGYEELKSGKTARSRRAFVNNFSNHVIRLHKPHPGSILKKYQVDRIIDELKKEELL
ncbi:MAG: hypothetical protein B6D64_09775 [Bacteroidetes bacterium 4484_276]|nr:MAG: hypothetical protein B6D64_09775 [Bacteroidetes bacterium 4484_276]OYT13536.1 MAG: hypothetical protein B6I19_04555 [Bacteroidetes bacterium 4572_114]